MPAAERVQWGGASSGRRATEAHVDAELPATTDHATAAVRRSVRLIRSTAMLTGVRRSTVRALAAAAILWAAVATVQAAAPAAAAGAQTDLSFVSNSIWTADPAAARVHVLVSVTATSHAVAADVRRYFYDDVQMELPPAATAISATSATGDPLSVTVQDTSPSAVTVDVPLGQRLYSGQTGSVYLKFDLIDNGGSTDRDLRLSHNLMSFPVSAFGSPGIPGSSVTVVFPPGFAVQEEFGGLTRSVYGTGEVAFASGILDDATTLSAWFTAVQPVPASGFLVRTVTIGPLQVALRYWADDPGWADRVEYVLGAGYPVLRDLIGLGDPTAKSLTVVEASTEEIGGFSGSYDQANGQVQISYFADPFVILHEAAHMWFNPDLLADRWAQEGFASYYAERAVVKLGLVDHAPLLTARLAQAAVPLNDWVTLGQANSATDAYLYAATLDVADRIAALAGDDGLRKVWSAARSGTAAYQPIHSPDQEVALGGPIDWRTFLDLLDQKTGDQFDFIWSRWIVDPTQAALIQQRATVLSAYASATAAAGAWELPAEIRRDMDTWQFDAAGALIDQAQAVLAQRDEIATLAATEGTTPPPTLKTLFEGRSVAAASAEAANELSALTAIAGARQAESSSQGGARALGLLGANPAADLAAARKDFASGDTAGATSLANSARSAWQGANGTGQARIFGAVALTAGLALLFVVFLLTRRERRRRDSVLAPARIVAGAGEAGPVDAHTDEAAEDPVPVGVAASAMTNSHDSVSRSGKSGDAVSARSPDHRSEDGPSGRRREHGRIGGLSRNLSDGDLGGVGLPPADGGGGGDDGDSGDGGDPEESAYDLLQRGTALLADRHNAQAAVVLERAARVEPGKGSILEALGRAYFNSGQHARAVEAFEALLDVDPSAHYGHFALGLSFARLGRPIEARTHLRLAVALDPDSETYRKALKKAESAVA
jgi:tetratricopeptide (TPR) repeat protein